MCLRPLAIGLVFLIAMGRRKFKMGALTRIMKKKETVGWQKFCWKASQEKTTGILRTVQSQSYYRVVCFLGSEHCQDYPTDICFTLLYFPSH